jgi:predicted membrane channel-forming protein YqfA (hemolysin III family)
MNPFNYAKTHWHALVIGAVAWHFVGPWVMSYAGNLTGSQSGQ